MNFIFVSLIMLVIILLLDMGDVFILYRGNHLSLVQPRHGRSIEFVTMVPLGRKVRRWSGGEEVGGEVLKNLMTDIRISAQL